jgi:hypothetical protein
MRRKTNRPVLATSRRSRLFRHRQERPAFRSSAFPSILMKMPVAGLNAVRSNALHAFASAIDHLNREFGELQQLREAVAEAERSNLNRQQRPQARPES